MSATKPIRRGGIIDLGWAADDDPIYQNGGWTFILGKNLNPRAGKPTSEPERPPEPPTGKDC
jgi:hypothetical protein